MLRYIAFAWNTHLKDSCEAARVMRDTADQTASLSCVLNESGFAVYASGFPSGSIRCYRLQERAGVVLGAVFKKSQVPTNGALDVIFDSVGSERVVKSRGRDLIESYWGRYVAFVRDPSSGICWVVQDPSAGHSVYRSTIRGVNVYYAELADYTNITGERPTVDWAYIASHVVVPIIQSSATALVGVTELQGGQCDEIVDGCPSTHEYWQPATFAKSPIEDFCEASLLLRRSVMQCVHTWASCYPNILHLLSGGVDSSIVLACLKSAPCEPRVVCVTYFTGGPGVDERAFAHLAADDAHCECIEWKMKADGSLDTFRQVAVGPRPSFYVSCLFESELADLARGLDASAIMTGNLGDGLFGAIADVRSAIDFVHYHGFGKGFIRAVTATAEVAQIAVLRVFAEALKGLWGTGWSRDPSMGFPTDQRLVSHSVVTEARERPDRYTHSWVVGARGLPPGKALHIGLMAQRVAVRTPMARTNDPEYGFPLASQLNFEACAAMPTYLFAANGRTRAIARSAFSEDVPPKILARRDKGNPSSWVQEFIRNNLRLARECLLDGQLVARGILDRRKIEEAVSGGATELIPSEVLYHVGTEVWLDLVR